MPRLQGFDSWGNARKRQIGVGAGECAGGKVVGQVALNDGRYYKNGECVLCGRKDLRPWKDGHIPPHSSKNPNKMAELERRARQG